MNQRNLLEHFWDCITRKYFQFSGRASRSEFWGYILFVLLINFVLGLVDDAILRYADLDYLTFGAEDVGNILFILPGMAVGVRRFHDTGRSGFIPYTFGIINSINMLSRIAFFTVNLGWFIPSGSLNGQSVTIGLAVFFVTLICLGIYYIIIAVQAGIRGLNAYGADPLNPHLGNEIDLIGEE